MSNESTSAREFSEFLSKIETAQKNLAAINNQEIEIATTPKEPVHRSEKSVLYHYCKEEKPSELAPVIIIYGLIGRQTMVDLQSDRSLVKNLMSKGVDIYEIDWGEPTRADRWLSIDDYVDDFIDEYVDWVREKSGFDKVTILGICEGGTFSAIYASLYPEKVNRLMLAITPIDFHGDRQSNRIEHGLINLWVRNVGENILDELIELYGCMPGELMGYVFQMMTPMKTLTKYNLDLIQAASHLPVLENFLRMEKWIADRPDHPGEAARQWFVDYYQKNKLVSGEITVNGRAVDLANITMPVLNLFATHDHIIPPECSRPLGQFVGTSDYTEIEVNSGHVGLFVSGKSQQAVAPKIVEWLGSSEVVESTSKSNVKTTQSNAKTTQSTPKANSNATSKAIPKTASKAKPKSTSKTSRKSTTERAKAKKVDAQKSAPSQVDTLMAKPSSATKKNSLQPSKARKPRAQQSQLEDLKLEDIELEGAKSEDLKPEDVKTEDVKTESSKPETPKSQRMEDIAEEQ